MEHLKAKKREEGRQFRELVWILFFSFWQLFKKFLIVDKQVITYFHSVKTGKGRKRISPFHKRET